MKLIVILCSIAVLFNWPVDSRRCYQCGCEYDWSTNTGTCSSLQFLASCGLIDVGNQYCFMISTYNGNNEQRVFEYVARDTFQDSHFFQAVETIALSGTIWIQTQISSIGYGCDWDGCNDMSLAQYLPESFQMKIGQSVLNDQLINGQLPAQACYSCSKCISELTAFLCKSVTCNGICYIDELHNYIVTATNNCTFNFFSYCESWNDPIPAPSIRIRATYYLDLPQEKQLEIDEVDIRCTKDNCNSIDIVEYLKGQIQTTVVIHPDFRPSRPNDTTTTMETMSTITATITQGSTSTTTAQGSTSTTTAQGSTSTTTIQGSTATIPTQSSTTMSQGPSSTQIRTTTTSQGPKSTRSYLTIFLYLIVILLLL